jgi:predicted permease
VRRALFRLWSFFRSGAADAELAREIDAHVQLLEDAYRARGMSERDARDAARRAFGGQIEQTRLRHRDARSFRWMDELWIDVNVGIRLLFKYPGLTIVGGLGMAVAIAISTVLFAMLYAVVTSTLPLHEGGRIVALENWNVDVNNEWRRALYDYRVWRGELTSFEELGAFRTVTRNLVVPGGSVEPISLAEVTASAFRIARVPPLLGRTLIDADEQPGAPPVIVAGHDVWQSRFGSDPSVVGRDVRLGHTVYTIVGVMPGGFLFPVRHSYWAPLAAATAGYGRGEGPPVFIFGRLAPGATIDAADAELSALGRRASAEFPETHGRLRPRVMPYAYPILDIQDLSMWQVAVMQASLTTLLVVVAVNVAVLIYARTATRRGEIAVRTAIGASRTRIVSQQFVEALVLAAAASVGGLLIATFGLQQAHLILALENTRPPYWIDDGIPWVAFAWVAALCLFAAVIAGVVPALQATSRRVEPTLRELSGSSGLRLGRTWTLLIVSQVALAVAALPIVLATTWSDMRDSTTGPAFSVDRYVVTAITVDADPPPGLDATTANRARSTQTAALESELMARLEHEPQVSDVTRAVRAPGQESASQIEVEGLPAIAGVGMEALINRIDVDFFDAFDRRLLTGRSFTTSDRIAAGGTLPGSPVVIVNRTFVSRMLAGGVALGRRVRYAPTAAAGEQTESPWYEIVGVVEDLHQNPIDPQILEPVLYHPLVRADAAAVNVIVRVSDRPDAFIRRLRDIAAAIDPGSRLMAYPLADIYRQRNVAFRLAAIALTLVVATVLLLSAAGIYALMSFTVAQRRKEIGIRVALGADAQHLFRGVFARAGLQLGLGVAAGIAMAIGADRLSGGDLFGREAAILVPAVSAMLSITGLLAAFGPARRGLRIQPTQVLRDE